MSQTGQVTRQKIIDKLCFWCRIKTRFSFVLTAMHKDCSAQSTQSPRVPFLHRCSTRTRRYAAVVASGQERATLREWSLRLMYRRRHLETQLVMGTRTCIQIETIFCVYFGQINCILSQQWNYEHFSYEIKHKICVVRKGGLFCCAGGY